MNNNDIKKRVTTPHNLLTIIDEETIRHLSSWKDLSHKEKDDNSQKSVCIENNIISPTLHSTQKAKHSKHFRINNINMTSKFLSQNQIELNKKFNLLPKDTNMKTTTHFKHNIPLSNNKSPLRLSPTNLKKIDISNTFFNAKAISSMPYGYSHSKSKKKLFHNVIKKTNSNSINKSTSNKRYSSRRNSNDGPTGSESNSHNNSKKNIEQTVAFSPCWKFVKKNKSNHSNEQNNNKVKSHNEDNKKITKNKSKSSFNGSENPKEVQVKIQEMANILNDNINNNVNKVFIHKKDLDKDNKVDTKVDTKVDIRKKKSFLCCIPLCRNKIEKPS